MKKEKSEDVKKLREKWNKLKTDKERIKFLVSEFSMSKKEAGEIVTKSWRDLPNEIKGYFNENKVQKYSEYIKEGTWALPKTEEDKEKCTGYIQELENFKKKIYNVIGDDILFDGLDSAISRINELINIK